MQKKTRLILFLVVGGVLLATLFGGVALSDQIRYANRYYEDQQSAANTSSNSKLFLFGDYEKEFCLGYLDGFKAESVADNETSEEAARITRKNQLITEYRAYVDNLYEKGMPEAEYDAHYQHLMDIYAELLSLEPEPSPETKLRYRTTGLRSSLEEEIYYGERNLSGITGEPNRNLPVLKDTLVKLKELEEALRNNTISFEPAVEKYKACVEQLKIGSPSMYKCEMENRPPIESLAD
jgi:hypothetical protein